MIISSFSGVTRTLGMAGTTVTLPMPSAPLAAVGGSARALVGGAAAGLGRGAGRHSRASATVTVTCQKETGYTRETNIGDEG